MTPQQRHMDQARKILSMLVPFSEWCPPWEKAVNELALALAAAENRAAWDVKQNQPDESTYEWLEAKYGPRPAKENQA